MSGLNGISPELQALEELYGANKVEWKYEMRREAQEILPGLYVGPFQPSWKLPILQRLGITHILCIAESRESHLFTARFPEHITYLIQEIRDADDQNLIRIFPQYARFSRPARSNRRIDRFPAAPIRAQAFIDSALSAGGRVLVHCGDGISRSPAIVSVISSAVLRGPHSRRSWFSSTAYVMIKTRLTHEDAFAFVQARRFCVAPRTEFVHQLEAYRPIILASQAVAADRGAQAGQRARRRGRDDSDEDDEGDISMGGMNADSDSMPRIPTAPVWTGTSY
ncbi:SPOSA6832_00830, partial [Sporobolomyces salmonicolor]